MCGGTLLSKDECLAGEDELLRHVGEAYLGDDTYYCPEEDDVVGREQAIVGGRNPYNSAEFSCMEWAELQQLRLRSPF